MYHQSLNCQLKLLKTKEIMNIRILLITLTFLVFRLGMAQESQLLTVSNFEPSFLCCSDSTSVNEEILVKFHASNVPALKQVKVSVTDSLGNTIGDFISNKKTLEKGDYLFDAGRRTKIHNGDGFLIVPISKDFLSKGEYTIQISLIDTEGKQSNIKNSIIKFQPFSLPFGE